MGPWRRLARGAALMTVLMSAGAQAQSVEARLDGYVARFEAPTDRYGHAIMGDLPEWGRLCLGPDVDPVCTTLPQSRVIEDIAPRLADIDGDGVPEAITVESSVEAGAALVIYRYGATLERIATPPIGTRNRWLAPIAIADLDGDGAVEIAYIDRPHLARTLRIWRYTRGSLVPIADAPDLTNHRIGDPFIEGGLRNCGDGPEMVVADGRWQHVMSVRLVGERIETERLAPYSARAMRAALRCR